MIRKTILPALIFMFFVLGLRTVHAQTVSFCADIKDNGQMIHPANVFAVTKKGGTIKMMVNLDHKVGVYKIEYKIYKVSDKGDQVLDAKIEDYVQPDWLWFYHDLMIRGPGNYMVYVYPEGSQEILASGLVKIVPANE